MTDVDRARPGTSSHRLDAGVGRPRAGAPSPADAPASAGAPAPVEAPSADEADALARLLPP